VGLRGLEADGVVIDRGIKKKKTYYVKKKLVVKPKQHNKYNKTLMVRPKTMIPVFGLFPLWLWRLSMRLAMGLQRLCDGC